MKWFTQRNFFHALDLAAFPGAEPGVVFGLPDVQQGAERLRLLVRAGG